MTYKAEVEKRAEELCNVLHALTCGKQDYTYRVVSYGAGCSKWCIISRGADQYGNASINFFADTYKELERQIDRANEAACFANHETELAKEA